MLPQYQCHKRVRAAKIDWISDCPALLGQKQGKALIKVGDTVIGTSWKWIYAKGAEAGGYYVEYEDGYTSYSPAAAFESGYTRVVADIMDAKSIAAKAALDNMLRSETAYAGPNSIHRDETWTGISHAQWPQSVINHFTSTDIINRLVDAIGCMGVQPTERRKSQRRIGSDWPPARRTGGDRRKK